jgi:indole-3-glycerol phosphate synthase
MPAAAEAPTLYLPEILEHVRGVVRARKSTADLRALEQAAAEHTPRGFATALRERSVTGRTAIISELKKASPSKGLIRESFDVGELAPMLEQAGAAALSVLTEERFFQGSLENLRRASAAVSIPCLRKDFMVDPFQMLEARANRADAILLIVAALSDAELRALRAAARELELDVLCEVHDREELERALPLQCECVGVNSRDLRTFEVSLERMAELGVQMQTLLPAWTVRVAESGLHAPEDIARMQRAGYGAFLIGESVMRKDHPGIALRALIGE